MGDGYEEESEVRDVLSFAVVELRDGTTRVEAIVQRSMEFEINEERYIEPDDAHPQLQNHLQFASEVRDHNGEPWKHHLILPPTGAATMLPVAPGTIRGVWAKPAITRADHGKTLTVTASSSIIVGDEVRAVTWGGRKIPTGIKDERIIGCLGGVAQRHADNYSRTQIQTTADDPDDWFHVPYLAGADNQVTRDIAFVEMGRLSGRAVPAKFYIADSLGAMHDVYHSNRLVDVTETCMANGMEFSHTVSAN